MANFLNTRIRLKYDTYQNWSTNNPTLLSGELAIVEVPNADQMAGDSVKPQILFKVGPGAFNSLPWASAKAADVHTWAKAEKLTIEKAAGQTGNVVSGISWDATNNKVTYTTASVATSEGLKDIQDRVGALETKEDKDTTYTFAKTTKGFTITPKGGSAQTISFEYLTPTEIADTYIAKKDAVALTGTQTISGYKTFSNGIAVTEDVEEVDSDVTYYFNGNIIMESDGEEVHNLYIPNIAVKNDITTALASYYTKNDTDGKFATKQYVDTTADDINQTIDELSKEVEANAIAIEALTNGTSTEEIDSVMELVDYVNEHGTEVQGMKDSIKANADAIDVIEAKPAMGITAQNITNWNNAHSANHSHSNKTVLDGITSAKVTSWDTAATNNHTHSNKTVLDGVTSTKVSNWDTAHSKAHDHTNKSVLDGITSDKVSNWNDAYTLLNSGYGFVQTIEIYENSASHEYGLSIYQENNEEGTENLIKLDDIKLNTGSHLGKTLGTLVSDVETLQGKKHVEYYDATTEDYSKGSFIICCGTSSKLV